jgi:hypothetical protein
MKITDLKKTKNLYKRILSEYAQLPTQLGATPAKSPGPATSNTNNRPTDPNKKDALGIRGNEKLYGAITTNGFTDEDIDALEQEWEVLAPAQADSVVGLASLSSKNPKVRELAQFLDRYKKDNPPVQESFASSLLARTILEAPDSPDNAPDLEKKNLRRRPMNPREGGEDMRADQSSDVNIKNDTILKYCKALYFAATEDPQELRNDAKEFDNKNNGIKILQKPGSTLDRKSYCDTYVAFIARYAPDILTINPADERSKRKDLSPNRNEDQPPDQSTVSRISDLFYRCLYKEQAIEIDGHQAPPTRDSLFANTDGTGNTVNQYLDTVGSKLKTINAIQYDLDSPFQRIPR